MVNETDVAVPVVTDDSGNGELQPRDKLAEGVARSKEDVGSKLLIQGNGLSFERSIPDALALRIMRLVITGSEGSGEVNDTGPGTRPGHEGRRESLAEFYRRVEPKRYPEKLTAIAAYLHTVQGRESITADDLRSQFRAVNEPLPANLPRDLKSAVGTGWLAEEHDQPGQYYVTRTGLEAVENGFADAPKRAVKVRKRKRQASPQEDARADA